MALLQIPSKLISRRRQPNFKYINSYKLGVSAYSHHAEGHELLKYKHKCLHIDLHSTYSRSKFLLEEGPSETQRRLHIPGLID